jgi:DNA-binding phage protein
MKNVKAPTSDSYHDYLVSRLKDPSYAALYLETHFEEEETPDPALLKLALSNVLEALSRSNLSPEQTERHSQKLDKILSQQGSDVIYGLSQWLNELGLKLTVAVAEQEHE